MQMLLKQSIKKNIFKKEWHEIYEGDWKENYAIYSEHKRNREFYNIC